MCISSRNLAEPRQPLKDSFPSLLTLRMSVSVHVRAGLVGSPWTGVTGNDESPDVDIRDGTVLGKV